nr:MAG TPA: hypothetical protein [Caudoviricetes sp.]
MKFFSLSVKYVFLSKRFKIRYCLLVGHLDVSG